MDNDEHFEDTRIIDGIAVEEALKEKGMLLCLSRWEEIKAQALKDILNEKIQGNSGLSVKDYAIKLYNQIEEWLEVPNQFIQAKEFAMAEDKRNKEVEKAQSAPWMEGRG